MQENDTNMVQAMSLPEVNSTDTSTEHVSDVSSAHLNATAAKLIASQDMGVQESLELNASFDKFSSQQFNTTKTLDRQISDTDESDAFYHKQLHVESPVVEPENSMHSQDSGGGNTIRLSTESRTHFHKVDTKKSPTLGRSRVNSKAQALMEHIRRSIEHEVLALAETEVETKEGVGGRGLATSVLLHSQQAPPSPCEPLHRSRSNSKLKGKEIMDDKEEEDEEQGVELQDLKTGLDEFSNMESYEQEETIVVIDEEEELKEGAGVGAGLTEPKKDSLVRKEIFRIGVVAVLAVLVVLLFVLT